MRPTGKSVIFVDLEESIAATVRAMIKQDVSSVLVTGAHSEVLGIVTERDLVRKVTLLEAPSKLERSVSTIMSLPVEFVRLENLDDDLAQIHLKRKFRHFPVLVGSEPVKANVVGMLTATDVVRQFATSFMKPPTDKGRPMVALVCGDWRTSTTLESLLRGLGYEVLSGEAEAVLDHIAGTTTPLVYDLDGFVTARNSALLKKVRGHAGILVLCTSEPRLVGPFRKRFDPHLQHVVLKPLDISYVQWLLRSFYEKASAAASPTSAA